jgi:putative FmdB family regulatory protein
MPVYSYRCNNCGVQFDRHQKFSDDHLKVCPECGEPELRKLFTPVGIVFKGSGFYSTDHRSPSGQSSAKKSEKSEKSDKSEKKTPAAEEKPSSPSDRKST